MGEGGEEGVSVAIESTSERLTKLIESGREVDEVMTEIEKLSEGKQLFAWASVLSDRKVEEAEGEGGASCWDVGAMTLMDLDEEELRGKEYSSKELREALEDRMISLSERVNTTRIDKDRIRKEHAILRADVVGIGFAFQLLREAEGLTFEQKKDLLTEQMSEGNQGKN